MRQLTTLSLSLVLLGCPSDEPTEPPSDPVVDLAARYVERGELGVGYTSLNAADGLSVKAWYPTEGVVDSPIEYLVPAKFFGTPDDLYGIFGDAQPDAPPLPGSHPLMVLSHGFGMNPEWYPLAEHLASYGFVVLGPEHIEVDWAGDILSATASRPLEVSATIDLAQSGVLEGTIDTSRVAVVGHSLGGYTALASAGARFELEQLAVRCETAEDPFILGLFCGPFVGAGAQLADALDLSAAPTGLWPSLQDSRVTAIVPIAGDSYLFGAEGLASVTVPALVIGGTADTGTPWDWGPGETFDGISSADRTLVALPGAEHFVPATSCDNLSFVEFLPEEYRAYICDDSGYPKAEGLDIIHHLTTAFLLDHNGDAAAGQILDASLYAEDRAVLTGPAF